MLVLPVPLRGRRTRQIGGALAAAGGLLILIEGLLLGPGVPTAYRDLALVCGVGILGAAVASDSTVRYAPVAGGAALLLAAVAFFTVNGYLLGAFLASLGGTVLVPLPGFAVTGRTGRPRFTAADLGPACVACGRHVPTWTTFCPYCGSSQPPARTPPAVL